MPMRIDILSCVPQLLESPFSHSILLRAIEKKLLQVHIHNLRDYSLDKHKKVDDYAYGGGAGMVLAVEPIARCITHLQAQTTYDELIYMAPDGEPLTQQLANQLSMKDNVLILCGHYKGVDERVRQRWMTRSISIGDYVLSGGELAAAVLVDALVRLIPGVLSDAMSALTDSFQEGLVAPPVYTRPYAYNGMCVPDVLLSGNKATIAAWEQEAALRTTQERRPALYEAWLQKQEKEKYA